MESGTKGERRDQRRRNRRKMRVSGRSLKKLLQIIARRARDKGPSKG